MIGLFTIPILVDTPRSPSFGSAIYDELAARGIEIPFDQIVVHQAS